MEVILAEYHVGQSNGQRQPGGLSLHSAGLAFDDLQGDAEKLAALALLASGDSDILDETARKALRAICTLTEGIACRAGILSEECIEARRAEWAANVAECPAR
jgi:hypothetical protein